ncbi:MAG: UDP-N-acetylenolpyruvoylglucosamine reductase [Xanthomonadales bacterium]|nr:UDP-N-acetylenolpyruvoylglucosamine reductase [Xanthomonadales bacterium]
MPARAAFLLEGEEAEPLAEALDAPAARRPAAARPRRGQQRALRRRLPRRGAALPAPRPEPPRRADEERVRIRVEAAEPWDAVVQARRRRRAVGHREPGRDPRQRGRGAGAEHRGLRARAGRDPRRPRAARARRRDAGCASPPADCGLAYRASRFREPQGQDRWLILALELELRRRPEPRLDYPGLRAALAAGGGREDDPAAIAAAVAALRRARLPDPRREPNAGSFFKNPVVDGETLARLRGLLPALPAWAEAAGRFKLPAAALIEAAGLKGASGEGCKVSERHALVLVNHAGATGAAVLALARRVRDGVFERFGIALEPEPAIVGAAWH